MATKMRYGYGQASVLLSGNTIEKIRALALGTFGNRTWEDIIRLLIQEHYELAELKKRQAK